MAYCLSRAMSEYDLAGRADPCLQYLEFRCIVHMAIVTTVTIGRYLARARVTKKYLPFTETASQTIIPRGQCRLADWGHLQLSEKMQSAETGKGRILQMV